MQAPWTLSGSGFMLIYKLPKDWVEANAQIPSFLKDSFSGNFGSLMLVDYQTSAVGPYKELLFIPGKFNFKDHKYQSISRIYVSSKESVEWGRRNWGIPKELANFEIQALGNNREQWRISVEGKVFFEIVMEWKSWRFPITTAVMPIKVVQENFDKVGHFFVTTPRANGKGNLAKIISLQIDSSFFPNLEEIKPLVSLRVSDFNMTFPIPIEI